jgi:diguanylate cyclase (GGDEF)-like protein
MCLKRIYLQDGKLYMSQKSNLKPWLVPKKLSTKLILPVAVAISLSVFYLTYNSYLANNIKSITRTISTHIIPEYQYLEANLMLLDRIVENLNFAVSSGEQEWVIHSKEFAQKIEYNLRALKVLYPKRDEFIKLSKQFESYMHIALEVSYALSDTEKSDQPINHDMAQKMIEQYKIIKHQFNKVFENAKDNLTLEIEETSDISSNMARNDLVLAPIIVLLLTSISIMVFIEFKRRVEVFVSKLYQLSSEGFDFKERILYEGRDELGALSDGFNKILEKFESEYRILDAERKELKLISSVDKLTGLYNRSFLDHALLDAVKNSSQGIPLGIILLDIDNFKKVNDTYGHLEGDTVLIYLSEVLRKTVRKGDIVGRWGGEEFMVIVKHVQSDYVITIAEKLRQALNKKPLKLVGHVSASFGATLYNHGESIDSMIKRTDDALYEAKRNGKNQVVFLQLPHV